MSTVQDYLGVPNSWKIVENIKHEIMLMPNKADIKFAKKKDPRGCALHNAACRVYEIPNCAIGGRIAYIPQRDAKGKPYIARVEATDETQRAIRTFDRTGKIPEGGFRFRPIAPSQGMKVRAKYMRERYHNQDGPARDYTPRLKKRSNLRAMPRSLNG